MIFFFEEKNKNKKMYRKVKTKKLIPTLPYPTLTDPTGYRLLVAGKVQYIMYSTRFDRWVVGKGTVSWVGKVVEKWVVGNFDPSSILFYYRPI